MTHIPQINWNSKLADLQERTPFSYLENEKVMKAAGKGLGALALTLGTASAVLSVTFTATPITVISVVLGTAILSTICAIAAYRLHNQHYHNDPQNLIASAKSTVNKMTQRLSWTGIARDFNLCREKGILSYEEANQLHLIPEAQELSLNDFLRKHGYSAPLNEQARQILVNKFFTNHQNQGFLALTREPELLRLLGLTKEFIAQRILPDELKHDYTTFSSRNGIRAIQYLSPEQKDVLRPSYVTYCLENRIPNTHTIIPLSPEDKRALAYKTCDSLHALVSGNTRDLIPVIAADVTFSTEKLSARTTLIKSLANISADEAWKHSEWLKAFGITEQNLLEIHQTKVENLFSGLISYKEFKANNKVLIATILASPYANQLRTAFLRMNPSLNEHKEDCIQLFSSLEHAKAAINFGIYLDAVNLTPEAFFEKHDVARILKEGVLPSDIHVFYQNLMTKQSGIQSQFDEQLRALSTNLEKKKTEIEEKYEAQHTINEQIDFKSRVAPLEVEKSALTNHLESAQAELAFFKKQQERKRSEKSEYERLLQQAEELKTFESQEKTIRSRLSLCKEKRDVVKGKTSTQLQESHNLLKLEALYVQLDKLKANPQSLQQQVDEMRNQTATGLIPALMMVNPLGSHQSKLRNAEEQLSSFRRIEEQIGEEIRPTKEEVEKAKDYVKQSEKKEAELKELKTEIRTLEEQVARGQWLKANKSNPVFNLPEIKHQLNHLQTQVDFIQTTIDQTTKQIQQVETRIQEIRNEFDKRQIFCEIEKSARLSKLTGQFNDEKIKLEIRKDQSIQETYSIPHQPFIVVENPYVSVAPSAPPLDE